MVKLQEVQSEKEISNEFYGIYHQTRLMLIRAFQEKTGVGKKMALYSAQRFMEKIVFLFFAVDNGLINNSKLFSERIFEILKKQECTNGSKNIWTDIDNLFRALDQGNLQLDIHGFGGNLFADRSPQNVYFLDFQSNRFFANEIMISNIKEPKLEGEDLKVWKEFGNEISPIIRNLLIMDSYDFKSTLNVTVLGHILEQSLDDLNEFQKTGEIKRKVEGVFYTPVTLTDYICRNTIIPYLSKNNANTVPELISEYRDNVEELEKKISQIKIIDPACGSGAFLINAAQILLEISKSIQMKKEKPQVSSGTLDEWQKEIETSKIIQNNIFGVDINRDSVEITKLSLFLIMAKPGEKLTNISKNIIQGNALVDDTEVDTHGFVWKDKFPKIIESGGFDIVIGNPPYQIIKTDLDEFFSPLKEMRLLLHDDTSTKNTVFSKLKKNKKDFFVNKCLKDKKIELLYKSYCDYYNNLKNYFVNTDNFKHQVSIVDGKKVKGIDINTYKLFLEKSYFILKNNGLFGMVLHNGISSDLGAKNLRELLLNSCQIIEFCGFINNKPIFKDVDSRFKFCTLLFQKSPNSKNFLAKFRQTDDTHLESFRSDAIIYDKNLLKLMSPDSLSFTEFDSNSQPIFAKIFKFPLLGKNTEFRGGRELDMSDDKHFFHTSNVGLKLFKGDMIWQFSDSFGPPVYWMEKKEIMNDLMRRERYRRQKTIKNKQNFVPRIHADDYRLAWRKLTNSTNKRTFISTILPPNSVLGNSLNYLWPHQFDEQHNDYVKSFSYNETLFLCGLFNSFIIDFVMRRRINTNLTVYFVKELPVPSFDENNILHKKILKNSSMLICTTDEYAKLREKVGILEYVTEPEKRLVLEAQINAAAAKIYDLTKEEFEYILESFPSVDKKLKESTMREFLLL